MIRSQALRIAAGLSVILALSAACSSDTSTTPRSQPNTISSSGPAPSDSPSATALPRPSGSPPVQAPTSPPKAREKVVEWILTLGPLGGAGGSKETAFDLLALGSCKDARAVARDRTEGFIPKFYEAAAAACLAAFNGRTDLWPYAQKISARTLTPEDCWDRAVIRLLRRLVTIHQQDPSVKMLRQPSRSGKTLPCARILELTPDHGPAAGGYTIRVTGVDLPPVVVIHFEQFTEDYESRDTEIRARSVGGTQAVIKAPRR